MTQTIRISEARKLFAANQGKLVHIGTIRRWIASGVKSVDGRVIRLKAMREGGRVVTRPEWVEQFTQELNGTMPIEVTPRVNGRLAAKRILIAEGIYGRKAGREMSDKALSPRRRHLRPMPPVLSGIPATEAKGIGDRAGTD